METVKINTEYIKLDSLLKFSGIVVTGGEAKLLISEGKVLLNGEVCTQRGKKVRPGDKVKSADNIIIVEA
jgi:ribosome-associated protein